MNVDPFAPSASRFPLGASANECGSSTPSSERPFMMRHAVTIEWAQAKHQTPYTNRPQKTTHVEDGRTVNDSYTTPDT